MEARLGDERVRVFADGLGASAGADAGGGGGGGEVGGKPVAVARVVGGEDAETVAVFEDVVEVVGVAARVGGDGAEQGFLAEVEAEELGGVGVEGAALGDAGADGVGEDDVAGADALEESRDAGVLAVGGEDDGVDVGVVEAAVDDVDAFEAGDGFEVDAVVEDEEVVTAGEGETHLAGEEAVLGVERVVGAGGEDDDGRGADVAGGEGAEVVEEL